MTGRLTFFLSAMCVCMIGVTLATSLKENILNALPRMIRDPWTIATFIDFYFNIVILSAWMVYKENRLGRSVLWFFSFVVLGSLSTFV